MKKLNKFLIIFFIIFLLTIIIICYFGKKITPLIMDYSINEMKRVATTIINRSVTDDTFNDIRMEDLFIINRNDEGEILTVTFDNRIVNIISNRISDECEDNIRLIEEGRYNEIKRKFNIGEEYFFVPSGVFLGNSLLNNIGPKIPINLKMIGNVNSEINTDIKEYGINNSFITIFLELKIELIVILPFSSENIIVSNNVPIAFKLIQGKVPHIYGGLIN